jgi:hypothetical protein
LALQQDVQLILAPAGVLLAENANRFDLVSRPGARSDFVGPLRAILYTGDASCLEPLGPAVESWPADAKSFARFGYVAAVAFMPFEPTQAGFRVA